ncbi:MAG: alpha-amylase family glycosyl hydrolase [Candidatus Hodarchaeota archaeon]
MLNQDFNWSKHPRIIEINTWPWLHSLSEIYGHKIDLSNVPVELIDQEYKYFDAVWLMGIWERSPRGRDIALNHEGLQKEYQKALDYYNTDDVIGSPYAIYYYHVDSHLGGTEALASFRKLLNDRGLTLILDYVPNHVAVDHLWTLEKSDFFIKGTLDDLMKKPFEYFSVGNTIYAHGRDPNFPPWTDTVQINAFSSDARSKASNTILSIAAQCDGVRCDMAMLMINDVFSNTWGEKAGTLPEREYWEEIIPKVKEKYPNFKFIAEVYWDLEWKLQQQGFDYCYDKKLYERLAKEDSRSIKEHLQANWDYQKKLLRFIENHDEQRSVSVFGEEASMAAALITLTLPGARLVFEGQMHGFEKKLPIQLGKYPTESDNIDIMLFYDILMEIIPGKEFENGNWKLCKVNPGDDNTHENIIAYQWWTEKDRLLVVVNYSLQISRAYIILEELDYGIADWSFNDVLNQKKYSYNGQDLKEKGLFVRLDPWKGHIFQVRKV